MRQTISLIISLSLFWLMNSGIYTPLILGLGVVSVGFVVFMVRRMDVLDFESQPMELLPRLPRYYAWLIKEIVVSNFKVVKHILVGNKSIAPAISLVHSDLKTDMGEVILANSITLTPGTVAVELEDGEVTVHALHGADLEGLQSGEMSRRVAQVERT
jgi:multicomponent Na+:H+ antiporter subunit E